MKKLEDIEQAVKEKKVPLDEIGKVQKLSTFFA